MKKNQTNNHIVYTTTTKEKLRKIALFGLFLAPLFLAGCATKMANLDDVANKKGSSSYSANEVQYADADYSKEQLSERTCLIRAMYFESNRSSREGMISVGTVVMNRVNSSAYPKTICGVVGQKNQFAPGVLVRKMNEGEALKLAAQAADAVLHGERSKKSKNAMFFHTAGLKFPYKNMHYVEVSGGNAFYEKRGRNGQLQLPVNDAPYSMALAFAQVKPSKVKNTPITNMPPASQAEEAPILALLSKDTTPSTANNAPNQPSNQTAQNVPLPEQSPKTKRINLASAEENDPFKQVILNYSMPSQKKLAEIGAILHKQRKNGF